MMEAPIFLLLAVSTYSMELSRQYHFINLTVIWSEAQRYCRENFEDLATAVSVVEAERLTGLLVHENPLNTDLTAWIGLYDGVNSWRWSLDNAYLYSDGNTQLESWFDFVPDNSGSKQHCGYMQGGTVYDGQCTDVMKSVCYDEPSDTFIAVTNFMRWKDAQSYCRRTYTDLASIRNQQEMENIKSLTDANQWWLGLSRDSWKWSDGNQSSYRLWGYRQPNGGSEHCAALIAKVGEWSDYACTATFPFICSGPPKNVLRLSLKTDGSLDLNDAIVQEAVLMQIERHLRQQGLQLQLKWRKNPNGTVFSVL